MDRSVRQLVRDRADHRCEYCHLPQAAAPAVTFQVEHIRARQHDGDDEPDNLALACPDCNRHKGPNLTGVDPETQLVTPLFNPRTQNWDEHFEFAAAVIVGSSPVGRATVRTLRMNIEDRVRMREALLLNGELS